MNRADGTPVNAVFGFTNMLARLLQTHAGTHLAVIFDAGRTTFRNRLYEDYKAHRPEPPDELIPQFALVRDATAAFGVPGLELEDWEADDLIASYTEAATAQGWHVTIVSSDKDLMQLVGPGVVMQDPIKQKPIGPAEVMEKFGVGPEKVIDVQALMGDSIDNVPGVPGIGPKNASQLITEYGDLEGVLAAIPSMKPSKRRDALAAHAEAARISRKLVTLCREVPLPMALDELLARDPDITRLSTWLLEQGFRSTAARLGAPNIVRAAAAAAAPAPEPGAQAPFGDYETVTTAERLQAWVAQARSCGVVAVWTETSEPGHLRGELVGIALATGANRACYLPFRHDADLPLDAPPAPPQLDIAHALPLLAPLLADPGVLKVFHDVKLHLAALHRAGLDDVGPTDDAMMISYAMGAGAHGHGLEELVRLQLGHSLAPIHTVTGSGRARLAFQRVPPQQATAYVAEQADATWRLWHALRPRLRAARALTLYERIERRLVPVLLGMERAGVRVDEAELNRLSTVFAERMAVQEAEIGRTVGHPINLGSPKALGELLFDEMALPGGKRTPSGAWGTDASVLQGLADQGHDLPARILDWRQLAKLRSTYTEALIGEINRETGRVHTTFAMAATTTGRISSNDPNLQNIPIRTEEGGRIRRAFVAAPGHVLVSCDYSQIELRLMAHVADIAPLKEAFATGQDIHVRTASEVFGVPMEGMDQATRRRAKAINFGIIYGISPFGLGRQLGIEPGMARVYIDAYFSKYPGIRDYMERTKEEARIAGYVLTPFGRRCYVPGIADRNVQRRAYAERQAINAPLQGGAADVIKRAMVRLPGALAAAGLGARMLLQVHDELLFEAPEAEAAETAAVAKRVMEGAVSISVPLEVETGQGASWAEAH